MKFLLIVYAFCVVLSSLLAQVSHGNWENMLAVRDLS